MSRSNVTATEASGVSARHAQAYANVLERLCGNVDLAEVAEDIIKEIARAVHSESAALRVDDRRGSHAVLASVGPEAELSLAPSSTGTSLRGSEAVVPLRLGKCVLGFVHVAVHRGKTLSTDDVAFLERVASRLGEAVDAWWRREEVHALAGMLDDSRRGVECMLVIGRMLSTVAHDIKNPLAGMMLAAQRLKRALDSLPNGEKLAHIAGRLCASVDSLSETASGVSRIAREPVLDMQRADLHGILGKATTLIGRRACVQGVRIARHLAAPTPRVRAHEHFLTRAFFNLTTNAIDAMPSGGVLSLRTRTLEGGRVEVVVADDGEGIGTEDVESLFRPFTSSRSGHAGLGLTLARRIIELHGGSILLRPAPGGGTEAVSDLPFGAHEAGG